VTTPPVLSSPLPQAPPLFPAADAEGRSWLPDPGGEQPIRVLVVDDSEDDAFLLKAELAMRGLLIDYRRVESEIDMAAALTCESWDVVISDHDMPGFDAFGALGTLKRSGRDIPFIICSGQIGRKLAVSAMYEGVDDCVDKGNYDRLLPVIERELRGAAARNAAHLAKSRLREITNFDGLSSLPNQNLFCARISEWLDERRRGASRQTGGALYVLDIDRFLRINSSFGYAAGSAILREIAMRLADVLAPDVLLARIGSDEFGIFVPGGGERIGAEGFARGIMHVFDTPFVRDGVELYLTASVGIALMDVAAPAPVMDLLMSAETAMSQVKRSGGNGYRLFDPCMSASSADRVSLEADLRHAVERRELVLLYQPVVDFEVGRTVGVEALLRWQHPKRGLLTPDHFIPLADETGSIVDIGAWVLEEACRQGKAWHAAGFEGLRMSVNVSAVQFGQPSLLSAVRGALAHSGFPADCLMLEITESSLMKDAETAAGTLRALKNMGLRLSVDDFGTGYSSLSYLKRFPIDVIKIDKSFVRDICDDEEDAAIVRAIIALAGSMRRVTIAEGVETREQTRLLHQEQCGLFQGFHFGRPVAPGEIQARLEHEREVAAGLQTQPAKGVPRQLKYS
jgi:diguanylate cyclase (GGDEF)-like protein